MYGTAYLGETVVVWAGYNGVASSYVVADNTVCADKVLHYN
jgi:hypothetical protein